MKKALVIFLFVAFSPLVRGQMISLELGWNNVIVDQPVMNGVIDIYNKNHPNLTNPLDHFNWLKGPEFNFSTYSDHLDFYLDIGWRAARCRTKSVDSLGSEEYGIMRGRMFNVGFGLEFVFINRDKFRWGIGGGLDVLTYNIIFGQTLFEKNAIKIIGYGVSNPVTDVHSNFLMLGKVQSSIQLGKALSFCIRPYYEIGIYDGNYYRFAQKLTPVEAAAKTKKDYKQPMSFVGISLAFAVSSNSDE